jgi:hypothetical protein
MHQVRIINQLQQETQRVTVVGDDAQVRPAAAEQGLNKTASTRMFV